MTNERQRLAITGSPGSGGFTCGFRDEWATTSIDRHPAAGELQEYLEGIGTIGSGNVLVSKESNWVYLLDYQNVLASQNLPELVVDYSELPIGATVQITTLIQGDDELGPPSGDAMQDAINAAYVALTKAKRGGPFTYPKSGDNADVAIEMLRPYQTVE
jgi:hypothetical protein